MIATLIAFKPLVRELKKNFRPVTLVWVMLSMSITIFFDIVAIVAFLFWVHLSLADKLIN